MTFDDRTQNNRPLSVWKEKDSIERREVMALVMILKSKGCSWAREAGCTMCGYNRVFYPDVSTKELTAQVNVAMERYEGEPYVKIFTSGSFFDPDEIPVDAQASIVEAVAERAPSVRLLVESRPGFVTRKGLDRISNMVDRLEVAIGLETSSDVIRAENIRKGFTWQDYIRAGRELLEGGALLKTYLLMKPPFLGEAHAIKDCISSIVDVSEGFPGSRISVNPMNIQSGTMVEGLFKRGLYRPPWLWSLLEVLRVGVQSTGGEVHLMSSPTAGGKKRGAHNCGDCDEEILKCIEDFSIDNDPRKIAGKYHSCMEEWKDLLIRSSSDPIGKHRIDRPII